jgi:hypothetical protein
MPEARFNLQDVQDSLYEFYLPTFRHNMKNDSHYFMNALNTGGYEKIDGKYAVYGLQKGIQGGVGALADGANYKTASTYGRAKQQVDMRNLTAQGSIDLKTIKAGDGGASFENLLAKEMETLWDTARDDTSRQIITPNSGIITGVATGAGLTGASVTPVDLILDSTERLQIGMKLDVISVGLAIVATNLLIVDIDDDNATITVLTDAALTYIVLDTDSVLNVGAYTNEIDGIEGALAATGTYNGIDKATNKWYIPQIKTVGATTGLSEADLREVKDRVNSRGNRNVDMITSNYGVAQGYEAELQTFKRYANTGSAPTQLAGGYESLTFDNQPFVKDRMMTPNTVYGLATSTWYKPTYQEWEYDDVDGSVFKFTAGQGYNFRMYEFCNLTTESPRNNFVINNLEEGA